MVWFRRKRRWIRKDRGRRTDGGGSAELGGAAEMEPLLRRRGGAVPRRQVRGDVGLLVGRRECLLLFFSGGG